MPAPALVFRRPTSRLHPGVATALVLVMALLPSLTGRAQTVADPATALEPPLARPPLPAPRPQPPAPGIELPPVPLPMEGPQRLAGLPRVFLRQIRFEGNTALNDDELGQVALPYLGREITSEDLQDLRLAITQAYVDRGYLNSGAVIPDQEVTDHTIRIRIVEGRLAAITVTGSGRLRPEYIGERLALGAEPPFNIHTLQERFQLLDADPLIATLKGEVLPGIRPGEAELQVEVTPASPFELEIQAANNQAPSVGSERLATRGAFRNVTGWGDTLAATWGRTEGAGDLTAVYALPLSAQGTLIELRYAVTDAAIIEEPFAEIDIESELVSYGATLSHPVLSSLAQRLVLGLTVERRHSETFLLGRPFSFSPGVIDGESDVFALRFSQEYVRQASHEVLAARSVISLGVDAWGATDNPVHPDGQFLAWLGQFQWARLLGWGSQLIFRTDLQLAAAPLLPMEKFAVGGAGSVRGFRENLFVKDSGLAASLEWRIPILRLPLPLVETGVADGVVQLAPFFDWGASWAKDVAAPDREALSSFGVGLRWEASARVHAQLYLARPLRDFDYADRDLQDDGIHFALSWRLL
ncbi:MAG: POTRA domain-containing protein [Thermodesulfobacteriota bacterium]